jgi:MFS family permease
MKQIWLLYLGYGIVYITPISVLQKWFPKHRGITVGVVLAGFALGSISMSEIALPLIKAVGLQWIFFILGIFYTVILVVSGWIMRPPPSQTLPTIIAVDTNNNNGNNHNNYVRNDSVPMVEESQGRTLEIRTLEQVAPTPATQYPSDEITLLILYLSSRTFILFYIVFFCNCLFGNYNNRNIEQSH